MSLRSEVERLLESRAPESIPPATSTTFFPNLGNPVAVTCDGVANTYGNNSTVLLAAGNTTGLWVVGIYATAFSAANVDYHVCISADPTGVAPVTVLGEVPFWSETTVVADSHPYMPLYKPVYIPAATILCLAASSGNAAGDTVNCWAICVLRMED